MIEGPVRPPAPRGPMKRLPVDQLLERARAALDALSAWLLPAGRRRVADAFLWRLQLAERVVWVVLAGLGIYLVVDLFVLRLRPPALAIPVASSLGPGAEAVVGEHLKPVADYHQLIAGRNPFGLTGGMRSPSVSDQAKESRLEQLTRTLVVVGINRGRVPEALIEDTQAKRTHFVKVGDQISGLTVKAIDKRGVTLAYEGEELLLQ